MRGVRAVRPLASAECRRRPVPRRQGFEAKKVQPTKPLLSRVGMENCYTRRIGPVKTDNLETSNARPNVDIPRVLRSHMFTSPVGVIIIRFELSSVPQSSRHLSPVVSMCSGISFVWRRKHPLESFFQLMILDLGSDMLSHGAWMGSRQLV